MAGQILTFIPKREGMLPVPAPGREDHAGLARGAAPKHCGDRTNRV